jgi:D-ribulokinase
LDYQARMRFNGLRMGTLRTFVGLDVGTSGARAVVMDAEGSLRAVAERTLPATPAESSSIHEQDPECWWDLVCTAVREVLARLTAEAASQIFEVRGVCVTSTSGSLVLADREGRAVRPAIMYDDARSREQAEQLNIQFEGGSARWNCSHSLCKALWVREQEVHAWSRVRYILSPADWLMGRLCNTYGVADYSNALKLGYDVEARAWAPAVLSCGIAADLLPAIAIPGTRVGKISPEAAAQTQLPASCYVIAGVTDGIAGLVASGARKPGDSSTTLGTTLVWKALSNTKPVCARGVYAHRHPLGLWAPGAASNTGPGAIMKQCDADIRTLDENAAQHLPIPIACYLVAGRGERFPFLNHSAATFFSPPPADSAQAHAAQLQALALTEKWGYELIEAAGVALSGPVYSAGSAARSQVLSQLRASVLDKPVVLCRNASAAFGAAILAASSEQFGGDLSEAIRCATNVERVVEPERHLVSRYEDLYLRFRQECQSRGYDS